MNTISQSDLKAQRAEMVTRLMRAVTLVTKQHAVYIQQYKLNKPATPYTRADVGTQVLVRRTGNLMRSITAYPAQVKGDKVVALIDSDTKYGKYHEFGTKRLRVRSFMHQPLAVRHAEIVKRIQQLMGG